jgi:flagellar biosynthesis/type III secretory pathway protein FliH
MSWSDGPPKVLKKVHAFSRVNFEAFDMPVDEAADERPTGPDHHFDTLADGPESPGEFLAITDHPDLAPSESGGPSARARCSDALEIVRQTEEEMAAYKEETCRQCTLLEQEAYDKGFATGEKDGIRAGEKKMQMLATELSAVIDSVAGLRKELVEQYETELLDLVLAICRKIIYCEISVNHQVIQETVRHILDDAPGGQPVTLRLHPKDMAAVEKLISSDDVSATDMNRVSMVSDTSVSRGGCRLETPHGDMDATIETRLKNVYDALKRAGTESDGTSSTHAG